MRKARAMRKATLLSISTVMSAIMAAPVTAQESRVWTGQEVAERLGLPDPPTVKICHAFRRIPLNALHFPEAVAELTQENGSRTQAELDAYAVALVRRYGIEPNGGEIVAYIRERQWDELLALANEYVSSDCWNDNPPMTVEEAATDMLREWQSPIFAAAMVEETLRRATHDPILLLRDEPLSLAGIPYRGSASLFDEVVGMFEKNGAGGWVLEIIDEVRAAEYFGLELDGDGEATKRKPPYGS